MAEPACRHPAAAYQTGPTAVPPVAPATCCPDRPPPASRNGSGRAGRCGSAEWRWRSAGCSWCATPSSRACSGRAPESPQAPLLAAGLIGAGEWLRRREFGFALPSLPSAHIPGVLTAAGTSTAFATAYAAHALYGLIGPGTAFVLLGAVAVLTMVGRRPARAGARGLGPRRRARLAAPRRVERPEPVGARALSRLRDGRRLRRGAPAALALARRVRRRRRDPLGAPPPGRKPMPARSWPTSSSRPRSPACSSSPTPIAAFPTRMPARTRSPAASFFSSRRSRCWSRSPWTRARPARFLPARWRFSPWASRSASPPPPWARPGRP